jgi:hypothetical protein
MESSCGLLRSEEPSIREGHHLELTREIYQCILSFGILK